MSGQELYIAMVLTAFAAFMTTLGVVSVIVRREPPTQPARAPATPGVD